MESHFGEARPRLVKVPGEGSWSQPFLSLETSFITETLRLASFSLILSPDFLRLGILRETYSILFLLAHCLLIFAVEPACLGLCWLFYPEA